MTNNADIYQQLRPKFSFFKGPITNKYPKKAVLLTDIYRGLTSDYYKERIENIRLLTNEQDRREQKKKLDYVTFAGVFKFRNGAFLVKPSGYICIDFDGIESGILNDIRNLLLNDPRIQTQLLFRSPSGNGLKWIVEMDLSRFPCHESNFAGVVAYLKKAYPGYFANGKDYIDKACKDIARACFMSYDPEAYINPKYIDNGK